jgi:8-oxo-dGTP pyrophosphatase MutT (NUDIX family)
VQRIGYRRGMPDTGGDGWIRCDLGHWHWGLFGAAGLLAYARDSAGLATVLMQHRSSDSSHGGTWGLFGGARRRGEPAVTAALREAAEECTLRVELVRAQGVLRDDHGNWSYETVIGELARPVAVRPANWETAEAAWVASDAVGELDLHPGFASQWPVLRGALAPLVIIIDAANVMGARADGWWRDRAGAAARLRDELSRLGARGIGALPEDVGAPPLEVWFPEIVLVVEGAARAIADGAAHRMDGAVRVVAAKGSGDDTIADLAGGPLGIRLVVTADRELRRRCRAAGAAVTGPRWLLGLL